MKALVFIGLLLLAGCATKNCANWNGQACRILRKRGLAADILILRVHGMPPRFHAVVVCPDGYYRDYTGGVMRKTKNIQDWGLPLFTVKDLDKHGKQFK